MVSMETAILRRIIEPDENGLSFELARYILTLDFSQPDHERMEQLAEQAQDGALSDHEQQELDSYLHVADFLALLQSKARRSLAQADAVS